MKTKLLLSFVFLIFIFSCKKENVEVVCGPTFSNNYIPMSVGSYWIYHWYEVDTLGNETLLGNKIDTVQIIGDTTIQGHLYFIQEETFAFDTPGIITTFYRDSIGYLLNSEGEISFSSTNFTDTLHRVSNSIFEINYQMETGISEITTEAGSFECLNFQGTVIPFGITVDWTERKQNSYYSKGVGKIQESTFYFNSPNELQRRLIEYHIE